MFGNAAGLVGLQRADKMPDDINVIKLRYLEGRLLLVILAKIKLPTVQRLPYLLRRAFFAGLWAA